VALSRLHHCACVNVRCPCEEILHSHKCDAFVCALLALAGAFLATCCVARCIYGNAYPPFAILPFTFIVAGWRPVALDSAVIQTCPCSTSSTVSVPRFRPRTTSCAH
jgi:hypothetical protein